MARLLLRTEGRRVHVSLLFRSTLLVQLLGSVSIVLSCQRFMNCNPCQPGRETRTPKKLIEMFVGTHISVLHHVLGFVIAVENCARDAEKALIVAPHNDLVEFGFARENASDNVFV